MNLQNEDLNQLMFEREFEESRVLGLQMIEDDLLAANQANFHHVRHESANSE